jgi:hypothetical protein
MSLTHHKLTIHAQNFAGKHNEIDLFQQADTKSDVEERAEAISTLQMKEKGEHRE